MTKRNAAQKCFAASGDSPLLCEPPPSPRSPLTLSPSHPLTLPSHRQRCASELREVPRHERVGAGVRLRRSTSRRTARSGSARGGRFGFGGSRKEEEDGSTDGAARRAPPGEMHAGRKPPLDIRLSKPEGIGARPSRPRRRAPSARTRADAKAVRVRLARVPRRDGRERGAGRRATMWYAVQRPGRHATRTRTTTRTLSRGGGESQRSKTPGSRSPGAGLVVRLGLASERRDLLLLVRAVRRARDARGVPPPGVGADGRREPGPRPPAGSGPPRGRSFAGSGPAKLPPVVGWDRGAPRRPGRGSRSAPRSPRLGGGLGPLGALPASATATHSSDSRPFRGIPRRTPRAGSRRGRSRRGRARRASSSNLVDVRSRGCRPGARGAEPSSPFPRRGRRRPRRGSRSRRGQAASRTDFVGLRRARRRPSS